MRALGRITLLGCFASVGAGLAICVGTSTPLPTDAPEPPPKLAVRVVTEDDIEPGEPATAMPSRLQRPLADPAPLRGADGVFESASPHAQGVYGPHPAVPTAPLPAPSYPRHSQQVVPDDGSNRLERVLELLQSQLGGPAEGLRLPPTSQGLPERALPLPPEPPESNTPAATGSTAPEIISGPPRAARPARAMVSGADDGRLAIHFPDNDIREVLELLSEQGNLNILASRSVQGRVSASLSGVDLQGALDAILKANGFVARRDGNFLFVGTPEDFASMEQSLDTVVTRVYRPNYITASELQKLIQPLLSERVGVVSVSTPSEAGIGSDANAAGGNNYAGGEVVLVRDYAGILAQIDQMVQEVDVRPLQVHIEAMILSVTLNEPEE